MSRHLVLRGTSLALLAMALTTVSAGAVLNAPPATTVRIAKIAVPGKPLRAFDISWVDSASGHYYLADRSNGAIDIVPVAGPDPACPNGCIAVYSSVNLDNMPGVTPSSALGAVP